MDESNVGFVKLGDAGTGGELLPHRTRLAGVTEQDSTIINTMELRVR
ncbi:hypothetical protein ACFQU9_14695 [Actinomadura namibiensis]|nr:hypothetical protein [Actinomadura namibiensis]